MKKSLLSFIMLLFGLFSSQAQSRLYADVNEDGEVSIADVNAVINVILGGTIPTSSGIQTFTVKGVSFKMISVEGGTFTLGTDSVGPSVAHQVRLSDYYIGQTEVTQALWVAVMGTNPSEFTGNLNKPVENVSRNDCMAFIQKLNEITGKNFNLPTEAQWEYAACGGALSQGYKYSGGNDVDEVAWYDENSGKITHVVAQKTPNELGLYDMSGNVWEWCRDWYGAYSPEMQANPTGPLSGSKRVYRGGSCTSSSGRCRARLRNSSSSKTKVGLRLVLLPGETIIANGVSFTMIPVEGGTFDMGAADDDIEASEYEKPQHQVTLSDFSIGLTEVSQALWEAVMDNNPSQNKAPEYPVDGPSWSDCQEFIHRLNVMTGKQFRLPTEAEWEFAARGGNMSMGYKFAGSNNINDVNEKSSLMGVGSMIPNELGLYNMSGSVGEWCQDWYGDYTTDEQINPTGPVAGPGRVVRGGMRLYNSTINARINCVTYRYYIYPNDGAQVIGLRLAL